MANTAKRKTVAQDNVAEVVVTDTAAASVVDNPAPVVAPIAQEKKELPTDLYVPCVSLIRTGKLVYVSKRQIGYEAVWKRFMDVQYIELKELIAMRSTDSSFFSENWIAIEDDFEYKDAVMEKLRIKEMYKNMSSTGEFDRIFLLPIAEMTSRVSGMSKTLKESIASYAKECIENNTLDSLKRIKALEGALGVKLS